MESFHAVILAAGLGTRMKSCTPKVLHLIAGLPLVSHVINAASAAGAESASLIVPADITGFDRVLENAPIPVRAVVQHERLGTAHAVLAARSHLEGQHKPIVTLYGDTPLITPASLSELLAALRGGAALAVMGFEAQNPYGYGRLLTDGAGRLSAIREEKDASTAEKAITLCNSGIMAFASGVLLPLLARIGRDNAAGEYYLTDAVEIARADNLPVTYSVTAEDNVRGVNDRVQLSEAEAIMQRRLRERAMQEGSTLIAPETVTFCHDTTLGRDVLIEPNVFFGPGVTVEDEVTIKGFSYIEGAVIGKGSIVGPFARMRPDTVLGPNVRIGNFVELKKAEIHAGAKVNHLTYIGDATVGDGANIGAGTITCNYDGVHKYRTEIGAGAFIGSNSALVAPVSIGEKAYVGAGSVVTDNVPDGALVVTRAPAKIREGYVARRMQNGGGTPGHGEPHSPKTHNDAAFPPLQNPPK